MKFYIAQCLGIVAATLKILSIQFKDKNKILIMFMLVNLVGGTGLFLLEGYTGSLICFVAVIQTLINYIYVRKDKKLPSYYIPIYVIMSLSVGLYSYREWMDIFTLICAMLYIASICQTKENKLRIYALLNIICWLIYNSYHRAYTDIFFKVIFLISNLNAIYKYDIKKKTEINNVENKE